MQRQRARSADDAAARPDDSPSAGKAARVASLPGGDSFCGVAAAVAVLGDAWTLLLVRDLAGGPRRFTELQASTGISARVLTDRLHTMAERGLVTRRMYAEIPPRVEYELTEKGNAAVAVVASLREYGEHWLRGTP